MGDPWSNEELKASLEVYLEMLEKQRLETPYVKTRYYKDLSEKYGRDPTCLASTKCGPTELKS